MRTLAYLWILVAVALNGFSNQLFASNLIHKSQGNSPVSDKIQYTDHAYLDHIKTVEMYRSGWRLSPPLRNFNDTTSLILEFDDLSEETTHYTYTIIHCTADWEPSDLNSSEYLKGITENEIQNFRYSRSALQNYKHYQLAIPNERVQLKLPGNYLLYVYNNFDQDQPVITRRFYIVDPQVQLVTNVHRTDNVKYLYSDQEVDFTIKYNQLPVNDPMRDFKVAICQNLNWGTAITDLLPKFVQPGELVYDYEEENLFPGGSEFLHFDTKNLKYNSDRVLDIRYEKPWKQVYLRPDLPRTYKSYEYQEDINGQYLVKWDEAFNSDTEADYVMVHFMLSYPDSLPGEDVYLYGGLTSWELNDANRCVYNPESHAYEVSLLLKQGYYNYAYATRKRSETKADFVAVNGSHYETENDYYLFVYFRDIRERFDRLVGMKIVNSVKVSKNY